MRRLVTDVVRLLGDLLETCVDLALGSLATRVRLIQFLANVAADVLVLFGFVAHHPLLLPGKPRLDILQPLFFLLLFMAGHRQELLAKLILRLRDQLSFQTTLRIFHLQPLLVAGSCLSQRWLGRFRLHGFPRLRLVSEIDLVRVQGPQLVLRDLKFVFEVNA